MFKAQLQDFDEEKQVGKKATKKTQKRKPPAKCKNQKERNSSSKIILDKIVQVL